MKKVFNYATLISLTVLFLFLSLLFLRMHCKLIYKGETKLAEIISEGYDLGDTPIINPRTYEKTQEYAEGFPPTALFGTS